MLNLVDQPERQEHAISLREERPARLQDSFLLPIRRHCLEVKVVHHAQSPFCSRAFLPRLRPVPVPQFFYNLKGCRVTYRRDIRLSALALPEQFDDRLCPCLLFRLMVSKTQPLELLVNRCTTAA